jgi:hypothetical protein
VAALRNVASLVKNVLADDTIVTAGSGAVYALRACRMQAHQKAPRVAAGPTVIMHAMTATMLTSEPLTPRS